MQHNTRCAVLAYAMAAALVGCSRGPASDKDSQVVATVNDHEITTSQLKQALHSAGSGATAEEPAATKQALDSLVNEELLVQKAIGSKLDRDPAVVHAIESARRQILVRAYAERSIFPKGDVTAADKHQYYQKNPLLFEQRKTYQLMVMTLPGDDVTPALRAELEKTHSADQVRELLNRHQLKYSAQLVSRAAEDLPSDMLAQFAQAAVGDVLTATQPDGKALLLSVTGIANSPLDFDQASPRIAQYLIASRNRKALEDQVKEYKAVAKISYSTEMAALQTVSDSSSHISNASKGL
jgi:EpsD family peptidyl-prolyl cis-trans isomerase